MFFCPFSEETVKSLQDKWNNVDFDEGMGGTPREFLEVCAHSNHKDGSLTP